MGCNTSKETSVPQNESNEAANEKEKEALNNSAGQYNIISCLDVL